jgi:hypothetical protein
LPQMGKSNFHECVIQRKYHTPRNHGLTTSMPP